MVAYKLQAFVRPSYCVGNFTAAHWLQTQWPTSKDVQEGEKNACSVESDKLMQKASRKYAGVNLVAAYVLT